MMIPLRYFAICTILIRVPSLAQNLRGIEAGFPDRWDGYLFKDAPCMRPPGKPSFPSWLDGYFLSQLSASYGRDLDPMGQKVTHMLDAIGAVASFHMNRGQDVRFSAEYYPALPFKIWDFYGKDLRKSTVAWPALFSPMNATSERLWSAIPQDPDTLDIHPNIDFWRIGRNVVGVTENAVWVGLQFDIPTLTDFRKPNIVESSEIFSDVVRSPIKPLGMPVHERVDSSGNIWGTASAFSPGNQKMYQIVFSISPAGVRTVEGIYEFGAFDMRHCDGGNHYLGDKRALASYGHSITSTETYIIIPVTSVVFNPCHLFKKESPSYSNYGNSDIRESLFKMELDPEVPLRFLIFNKRTKRFATERPLESNPAMFISHQFNAYEKVDGTIIADMIAYDNFDIYNKYFYVDYLKRQGIPDSARLLRFTISVNQSRIKWDSLIPQTKVAAEFPQFNHLFEGKYYTYGYVVQYPFAAGSQIIKMNMNDPSGRSNLLFSPGSNFVLSEPVFVARPGAVEEDDGVLLIRALDTTMKLSNIILVNAKTMTEMSRIIAPVAVPFGFHNRYYSKQELGLPSGTYSFSNTAAAVRVLPLMPTRPDLPQPPTHSGQGYGKPDEELNQRSTHPWNVPNPNRPDTDKWGGAPVVPPVTNSIDNRITPPGNLMESAKHGICNWLRDIFEQMGSDFCKTKQ